MMMMMIGTVQCHNGRNIDSVDSLMNCMNMKHQKGIQNYYKLRSLGYDGKLKNDDYGYHGQTSVDDGDDDVYGDFYDVVSD